MLKEKIEDLYNEFLNQNMSLYRDITKFLNNMKVKPHVLESVKNAILIEEASKNRAKLAAETDTKLNQYRREALKSNDENSLALSHWILDLRNQIYEERKKAEELRFSFAFVIQIKFEELVEMGLVSNSINEFSKEVINDYKIYLNK